MPLGGNRKGVVRTYINLFLTMLLGGLWHGANWTFIVWGAWHGMILAIERYWGERFGVIGIPHWLRVMKTMLLVMIGWVFFRSANVTEAGRMFNGMLGLNGIEFGDAVAWQVTTDRLLVLLIGVLLVYAMPLLKRNAQSPLRFLIIPLFVWALATLSAQSFTPFLYFQF